MLDKEKMLERADVLDSGKYKQVRGIWGGKFLGRHCCLSVAAVHFLNKDYDELVVDAIGPSRYQVIIREVRKTIAGIFEDQIINENFDPSEWVRKFEIMNDEEKLTFPQIATRIRGMVAAESD